MNLSTFKNYLKELKTISFEFPNGQLVPAHFHVTEVGLIDKKFIDCGGKLRNEQKINFQLWEENDYNHRLHPEKLIHIIELSEKLLNLPNEEIEIEYQGTTIEKYGIAMKGNNFQLTKTLTDCLAKDKCGIQEEINTTTNCTPGSGCC